MCTGNGNTHKINFANTNNNEDDEVAQKKKISRQLFYDQMFRVHSNNNLV